MDIIYSRDGVELGVLTKFTLDFEASTEKSKNTFEIKCPLADNVLNIGYYFFADNSEIGGKVDSYKVDTAAALAYFGGRTWRGMLESKILEPPVGSSHYIVSGDVNDILAEIITKIDYEGIFRANEAPSGYTVEGFQFPRYIDAYKGIIRLLSSVGLKLQINHKNNFTYIEAVPITDYSNMAELTSDTFDFKIEKKIASCNHMIGLGSGELTERLVVHKYLDADGNVSDTQYFFGADEIVAVYDNGNAESIEDLTEGTVDALLDCAVENSIDIKSYDLQADIGDKFLAYDNVTGISVEQYVVDIVTNIDENTVRRQYKVGDELI